MVRSWLAGSTKNVYTDAETCTNDEGATEPPETVMPALEKVTAVLKVAVKASELVSDGLAALVDSTTEAGFSLCTSEMELAALGLPARSRTAPAGMVTTTVTARADGLTVTTDRPVVLL